MGADEIVKGIAGIKASLASRSHEKQASVGSNGCGNQPGPDGGVGGLLFSPLRWRRLHGIHYPGHDHIPLQYNFTINGFDTEGKKTSIQIEFKNDKPAKQLIGELTAFTGLAMGQTRSAEEILTAERDGETTLQSLAKAKEGLLRKARSTAAQWM